MIRFNPDQQRLTLSIRDLLQNDESRLGVYLPGRGQLGTRLHQQFQSERRRQHPDYQSEVVLRSELAVEDVTVILQGRLDGLLLKPEPVVEELKSTLLPLAGHPALSPATQPDWFEQLDYYCWQASRELELVSVTGRLILLPTQGEGQLQHEHQIDLGRIEQRLFRRLRDIITGQRRQADHLRQRRTIQVHFPFDEVRPGQEQLLEAVSKAAGGNYPLVVQAPTGSGKTVGTLIPALQQALLQGRRVFVVTPKNSGQQSFLELLYLLNESVGQPLNCVRMPAREKICPADRYICDPDYCPFLQDFQAALKRGVGFLENRPVVGEEDLRLAAEQYRVCPHELALSLSETRDVVIGDYNHVFAPNSQIRRLFRTGRSEEFFLLVDEAHHFPARARSWYSSDLSLRELEEVIEQCRQREKQEFISPNLFGSESPTATLRRGFERFLEICRQQDCFVTDRWSWQNCNSATFRSDEWEELALELAEAFISWILHHKIRGSLLEKDAVSSMYYDLQYFLYLTRFNGEGFEQFVEQRQQDKLLRVLCLAMPESVREQLTEFPSAVFFSATLPPPAVYLEIAGLNRDTPMLQLPSSFPSENRKVVIHDGVNTRLRYRTASVPQLAELIVSCFRESGVNMAVFFPSFSYLAQVRKQLPAGMPLLVQEPDQSNSSRAALLSSLKQERPQLLLAVSGGSFAEGIDLPGRELQLVVVVGPSLPAISIDNELIQAYYNNREQDGFAYAYRIPGMNSVAQSSGRLIRSASDRGLLVLVGQRFTLEEYRRLLPEEIDRTAVICHSNSELLRELTGVHFLR